jgi:hypothetical protein
LGKLLQTVQAEEQLGTAPVDKIEVQMLAMTCQQVEDGGIYKLRQICTAPFSNNRSTHSHPVVMGIHKYLVELGLNIPLHFWDGGIYRTRQIYRFQFLNNTDMEVPRAVLGSPP